MIMKNQKLRNALEKVSKKPSNSFEQLGIEKIRTVKGGINGNGGLSSCSGTNCPQVNCGWN